MILALALLFFGFSAVLSGSISIVLSWFVTPKTGNATEFFILLLAGLIALGAAETRREQLTREG